MRARPILVAASLLISISPCLKADLSKALAEKNLERRARLALENAQAQIKLAAKSYSAGDWEKTMAALQEMLESAELAEKSLQATGRNPRNARSYKNLEVRTRDLLKHLSALLDRMTFEERQKLAPVVEQLRRIHDDALWAVMGGRPPGR